MNPKSGKAGSAVSPTNPKTPTAAATANPGAMTQVQGKSQAKPAGPPHKSNPAKKSWIEIELVGEDNLPIPGEAYQITLPDGSVAEGTLDEKGFARVDGIDPGSCQISFPNLDKDAWQKI